MLEVPPRCGVVFLNHGGSTETTGDVIFLVGWVKNTNYNEKWVIFLLGDSFCWVGKYSHDGSMEKWYIYLHE